MSAVGKVIGGVAKGVTGAIGLGVSSLFSRPKSAQPQVDQIRQPVRSAAIQAGRGDDARRRRQGFAANILNGRSGAEAPASSLSTKILFGG